MRIELSGSDTATFGEVSVKSNVAPICKLARKMIESGVSDSDLVEVYRGDTKCFGFKPISYWADRTTSENGSTSVRFASFVPFSGITSEPVCAS